MTEARYSQNRQLAWERLQRGWSYEEVASRIRAAMKCADESDTGLTANTVRRWEIGERWPDPRFRKHLVTVFEQPASDLGLLLPVELEMRPITDVAGEVRRLLSMVDDEIRASGLDRATVLRGLLGAGTLPVIARLFGNDTEPLQRIAAATDGHVTDAEAAAAYTRMVDGQRSLYWSSPASELFETVYANAQLGVRLIRGASHDGVRTELGTALAETAMLAGRLAFFDLNEPAIAQRCYATALRATRDAGDHAFAATVLGHMAFIPAFAGDTAQAIDLTDAAMQHCWHGAPSLVRSWLHCVASEATARSAEPSGYDRRIALAQESLTPDAEAPAWFDFYDASRLNGFAGYCALAAGDSDTAASRLKVALDQLAPTATKQRSVLLADLATARLANPEQSTELLHDALTVIENDWYATGYQRVGEVTRRLPEGSGKTELFGRFRALNPAGVW